MKCPFCGQEDTKVIDSRPADDNSSIRRRRQCDKCGKRFTTYETIEDVPVIVIKKDRSREVFDRNKILKGMLRACEKRKVTVAELDEKIAEIIKKILIPPKPIDIRIKKYLMKETSKIDFELYEELQVKPSSKRFLEGNNISTDLFEKFYSIYYIVHGIEDFCKACYRKIQYFNPVFLMKNLGIYDYLLNS